MMHGGALLTDLYELTMMQGYFRHDMHHRAVFDMFFRRQPFNGGYVVVAGLEPLLRALEALHFSADDIAYLDSLGMFDRDFLDYLSELRFTGDVCAMPEGTIAFPHEPLLRVHTTIPEAQLIEGMLLNTINFQTLVATKTARIYLATGKGSVAEFGLRRAQGRDGALSASRAAFVGGASTTSNTLAGKTYGIPVTGTMAHSWVMAFPDERTAFERYAELYPDNAMLLIDTYDSLGSGIENAIAVGRALKSRGKPVGVRLDSGDIEYLSKEVRRRLDEAGLEDARIAVSNELDESIVHQLVSVDSPIDLWGVGTQLVTGGSDPALTGVYKLAAKEKRDGTFEPTMKVSDNPEKATNPGIKQVHRFYDRNNSPIADLVALDDEEITTGRPYTFYHPATDYRKFRLERYHRIEPLLMPVMRGGEIVGELPSLEAIQDRARQGLATLDETYKRIINPHIYKVSISKRIKRIKQEYLREYILEEE